MLDENVKTFTPEAIEYFNKSKYSDEFFILNRDIFHELFHEPSKTMWETSKIGRKAIEACIIITNGSSTKVYDLNDMKRMLNYIAKWEKYKDIIEKRYYINQRKKKLGQDFE